MSYKLLQNMLRCYIVNIHVHLSHYNYLQLRRHDLVQIEQLL